MRFYKYDIASGQILEGGYYQPEIAEASTRIAAIEAEARAAALREVAEGWRAFAENIDKAIAEAGIFNAGAAGTMLARATFTAINKGASDTLAITWTVTVG